ncbi:MAG: sodium/solute symporter [Pseudomonadota bacterium]|nr:sodium/solute symporter [Pseudomonadota bacterium]
MTTIDWIIVTLYMAFMIGLSVYLGRGQTNQEDYYLGGRDLPWWSVAISTMATQTSAVSFMSIPAFVALKPGGGLTWLQYELAVPLAMIAVSMFLLPFFRRLELISVYRYLELRFGPAVRTLISAVFLLSRALGTGVGLYASAIILTVIFDIPLSGTILLMAVVTVIYDTIGGMKAVVYSDVIQSVILFLGIFLCIGFAISMFGGFDGLLTALPAERWRTIDPATGLGDGGQTPFWGFLVGGLFLYMAYYGTDQSQVQRELSTASEADTRKSLYFNGFVRFPLTVMYLFMGLALGAAYSASTELQNQVPVEFMDFLVPVFILQELPVVVRGILVSALLAGAMSSLDSALNSLSAVTMRDFVEKHSDLSDRQSLIFGRVTTLIWGVIIIGFAFLVGNISETVVESINMIGSAFYGPILAAFLVGVLSQRATSAGIFSGVLAGIGLNLVLWVGFPEIFWMWWNLFGLLAAVVVTFLVSLVTPGRPPEEVRPYTLAGSGFLGEQQLWRRGYTMLVGYFLVLLGILLALDYFATDILPALK